MRYWILSLFFVGMSANLLGQSQPPSDAALAAISARGRALAEYDAAAWHSSDAVVPLNPTKEAVQLYVARKTESGWVVMWGRLNETKTKFLIVYEAREGADPTSYKVIPHDPPLEDGDLYLREAKAHEVASADFLHQAHASLTYNVSVLPSPSGGWYVYFIPAQTDARIVPYGADWRYTISPDGETIDEKRQMHQTLMESGVAKVQVGVHSHVLSDLPEDSDVFYTMAVKASEGDWIVAKAYVYTIGPDGLVRLLGRNEDVVKMLQDGKFAEIAEPYRSMLKSFVEKGSGGDAVVAFASLSGARCDGKILRLKFSVVLNNRTEYRLVLNRRALWNAQLRFGASDADILAGKYEKTVIVAPDKVDYSDVRAFLPFDPGMVYSEEQEYPVADTGLLKGKSAVQILFFTWPPLETDQIQAQQARWAKFGNLFTDDVLAPSAPMQLDRKALAECTSR